MPLQSPDPVIILRNNYLIHYSNLDFSKVFQNKVIIVGCFSIKS